MRNSTFRCHVDKDNCHKRVAQRPGGFGYGYVCACVVQYYCWCMFYYLKHTRTLRVKHISKGRLTTFSNVIIWNCCVLAVRSVTNVEVMVHPVVETHVKEDVIETQVLLLLLSDLEVCLQKSVTTRVRQQFRADGNVTSYDMAR